MSTRFQRRRLLLASLLVLPLACFSSKAISYRQVGFHEAEDVLGDTGAADQLAGGLPQVFLVGPGSEAGALFEARRSLAETFGEGAFTTLVDLADLAEATSSAIYDQALDEALELEGVVLLDHSGATSAELTDGRGGLWLLRVSAELEVTSELALPSDEAALAGVFGGAE